MLKTFTTSLKLKITYNVNSFIYSLKQFPIIRNFISSDIYGNEELKNMIAIFSLILSFIKLLFFKTLYIFFLMVLPYILITEQVGEVNTFLTIFVFLTLIGAIINNHSFEMSRDRYYAIFQLKMSPKYFALSDYFLEFIKILIGFIPVTLFFGEVFNTSKFICILLPIFIILCKSIGIASEIKIFEKKGTYNESLTTKPFNYFLVIVFFICAYALPFFKIIISEKIFLIIFSITAIISIFSFRKIFRFDKYNIVLKKVLSIDNIKRAEITKEKQLKEESIDSIEYTENIISNKKGYAYFNELFEKRHSNILSKIVNQQIKWIIAIFIIITLIAIFIPQARKGINNSILEILPLMSLLMYFLNRGIQLTQAMFMNCDHSMLTYSFYKTPKVILGLFKERLKTLIKYNIIPALIIATFLPILLLITGGTDNFLNYIIIFISIICMSIFFSVHYLVLYYLLQPYNAATEVKSSTYNATHALTYAVIYFISDIPVSVMLFGTIIIIFTITYVIVSLIIVYLKAPKTFKLRN